MWKYTCALSGLLLVLVCVCIVVGMRASGTGKIVAVTESGRALAGSRYSEQVHFGSVNVLAINFRLLTFPPPPSTI